MGRTLRSIYVHGRPGTHPNRVRLVDTIGSKWIPADFWLPWMHDPCPSLWRKWVSIFGCAFRFPEIRQWDLIFGDGPQHLPVVMRLMKRLGNHQKIIPWLAGEFPYFLVAGYYGPRKTQLLRWLFHYWDVYLCISPMVADLVRQVLPPHRGRDIFTIQNFVRQERLSTLQILKPTLKDPAIVFIGNGTGGFRIYYKGLDLLLKSLSIALQGTPQLQLTVVGQWESPVVRALQERFPRCQGRVEFIGHTEHIGDILANHSLYLHCGRGDAWPGTVIEAMAAGVPAMVTEWTGAREAVAQVDPRLVVPLDPHAIAERILWYFSLPVAERRELGERGRQVVLEQYTEKRAIQVFRATMRQILDHLGMNDLELPPWDDRQTD